MRPTAVTVIGIIGIVLGILGLCCNIVGMVGAGSLPMLAEMAQQSGEQSPELQQMLNNPALMRYTMVSAIVGLVLSVWMIVASILLLGMKPIGYTLNAGERGRAAALGNRGHDCRDSDCRRMNRPRSSVSQFQIAFPVAVLIVLTRPNIKEAFQSGGF
jgi:hypothetical protein